MDSIYPFILFVNIIGFILMRIDKQKSVKNQFRIPERTFWLIAILGGAIGTLLGMRTFRHKTKHRTFTIGMPILVIFNLVVFAYIMVIS